MSTIALPDTKPLDAKRGMSPWQKWGLILLAPYVVVFLVFVVYPVGYGLWLARHPVSYEHLVDDPIFLRSVLNTLAFLVIAINIKMLVALFLSGFFIRTRTWICGCSLTTTRPAGTLTVSTGTTRAGMSVRSGFASFWATIQRAQARPSAMMARPGSRRKRSRAAGGAVDGAAATGYTLALGPSTGLPRPRIQGG